MDETGRGFDHDLKARLKSKIKYLIFSCATGWFVAIISSGMVFLYRLRFGLVERFSPEHILFPLVIILFIFLMAEAIHVGRSLSDTLRKNDS